MSRVADNRYWHPRPWHRRQRPTVNCPGWGRGSEVVRRQAYARSMALRTSAPATKPPGAPDLAVRRTTAVAAVLDVVLIVVFAAIGRASHSESHPVLESALVAWPFLVGAAVGWALAFGVRRWAPASLRAGVPVWVGAVAVGMILRVLTGRGVAVSFVIVATIVLAVFLLGWRGIVAGWQQRMRS